MGAQVLGAREEEIDRILGVFQPFHVCKKTACFYCEQKTGRNRSRPVSKSLLFWEPVKRVVDFDGMKLSRIPRQHLRRRKTGRIEISKPVFVVPPRGPDVNCRRPDAHRFGTFSRRGFVLAHALASVSRRSTARRSTARCPGARCFASGLRPTRGSATS